MSSEKVIRKRKREREKERHREEHENEREGPTPVLEIKEPCFVVHLPLESLGIVEASVALVGELLAAHGLRPHAEETAGELPHAGVGRADLPPQIDWENENVFRVLCAD